MAEFLTLRGRSALSAFRVNKLLADLAGTRIAGITADYFHFVAASRALSADERVTLERLLTYGPLTSGHADAGELLLVIPRPGTISPWASKATDIAHNCGLDAITRIERGVAYRRSARAPRWAR
jgi:phosphoribosylformylglycinamidine synthase